jgi:RHH-type proline utilization regulon transcriptional repressor/proline dehydrogenase/delta 1-pyrroline-5-carboxylate dehydrogenase
MVIDMAYGAGVPKGVLTLANVSGTRLSSIVLMHPKIAGVVFTGSTETARIINQNLAQRTGALIPFIAETGGINAMIVDSSALPEQVVTDVISSAFQSAGQRCSALRLLIVQNDIADTLIEMLKGAMAELKIGPAYLLSTDIGPVIDAAAKEKLDVYCAALKKIAESGDSVQCLYECAMPDDLPKGSGDYVAPVIFQVGSVADVKAEIFGPILHVVRYRGEYLDQVINDINALGYGLTLGLHTRLESTMEMVAARARVGNLYVNRNMIGAVVGVQPFGGEGMSGTGFKSGGPNYLLKFVTERVYTQNTTAAGGNASLVSSV